MPAGPHSCGVTGWCGTSERRGRFSSSLLLLVLLPLPLLLLLAVLLFFILDSSARVAPHTGAGTARANGMLALVPSRNNDAWRLAIVSIYLSQSMHTVM